MHTEIRCRKRPLTNAVNDAMSTDQSSIYQHKRFSSCMPLFNAVQERLQETTE